VLWAICLWNRVSLIKLLNYLREELLIIIGTSSSEPALPGLLRKLEAMGCSRTVSGLVPAGYSFNLDGTSIYLTVSALFLAQTTGTHLTGGQEALIAAPPYGELQRLCCSGWGKLHHTCATLKALGSVPVASIALLLGIDRIMSHCRSITNLIGNAVATITIARSENEFDRVLADRILSRPHSEEDSITV
jgi:aerobic C4-dicarboxylate transport protein